MKKTMNSYIDAHREEFIELGNKLFNTPELGFKEFRTREIIKDFAERHGLKVSGEFAKTGLSLSIGKGKPHIGIIAEMDGLPTAGHPCRNKEDDAAHSCGHSTQVSIALAALCALKEAGAEDKGTVTVYFCPAEEFCDLQYRQQLQKDGEIRYLSGKQNMIAQHVFDEADVLIHFHASGNRSGYRYSINTDLAGFTYKKYTFIGKAAHAGVSPDQGINALNMLNLFLNAVNSLRETFRDEDMVRVHGRILEAGRVINSIPDKAVYECYLRSIDPQYLLKLNSLVDNAARHCALALSGECQIEEIPGYLPLIQDRNLSKVVYENMLMFTTEDKIRTSSRSVAAGDVGDVSMFKPVIQYGYTGFSGTIHGKDLLVEDEEEVYITQPKILAGSVYDLLEDSDLLKGITSGFKPKMTYEQYINYLENK